MKTGSRKVGAIATIVVVASCTSFSGEDLAKDPVEGGVDDGTAPDGGTGSIAAPFGGCSAARQFLFCETFEDPFAFTGTDQAEGDGIRDVAPSPERPSGRSLHVTLPNDTSSSSRVVGIDRTIAPGASPVIVDAEVYVAKAPAANNGQMGILSILAGGDPLFSAILFVKSNGELTLSTQTPEENFQSSQVADVLPARRWTNIRLEVDHDAPRYRVFVGKTGEPLALKLETSPKKTGAPATPLRVLAGIQRYNAGTPPLEVFFEHIAVSKR